MNCCVVGRATTRSNSNTVQVVNQLLLQRHRLISITTSQLRLQPHSSLPIASSCLSSSLRKKRFSVIFTHSRQTFHKHNQLSVRCFSSRQPPSQRRRRVVDVEAEQVSVEPKSKRPDVLTYAPFLYNRRTAFLFNPTGQRYLIIAGGVVFIIWLWNREEVPVTGRKQFNIMPQRLEHALGNSTFQSIVNSEKTLPDSDRRVQMVRRIGQRIAKATGKTDWEWKFAVIDSPLVNAMCAPGGKVIVFTGLIDRLLEMEGLPNYDAMQRTRSRRLLRSSTVKPITVSHQEDLIDVHVENRTFVNLLACVIAHEVGHALARHTAAQLSMAVPLLAFAVAFNIDQWVFHLFVQLPFSRKNELEADALGLVLMARACYNPAVGAELWKRFSGTKDRIKEPFSEYLSTHPADERRSHNCEEWYEKAAQEMKRCCAT